YDIVTALTSWLQANYRYSLEIGHVQPGVDAVDQFLFADKKGYCEQFATAATLMLRSLGIPARLATGYSTGTYDPVLNQSVVRERDAHAWVEVFFPNDGWVPVDPSPGFAGLPATTFPDRWAASGIARLIPHLTIGAAPAILASAGFLGVIPPAIAIALVFVLAYAWLRRRLVRRRRRAAEPPGSSDLLDLYDRLQKRSGRSRAPPETPPDYRGKVATLPPAEFAAMMAQLEADEEQAVRPEIFAYLLHSQNTADPAAGRLLARAREAGAERGSHMVFFPLELAAITDEQAAALFADPGAAKYRHHIEQARKFRPHQLTEPEERVLTDFSPVGNSAWVRLFEELCAGIRMEIDGKDVGLEEALTQLHEPDREVRRRASTAITGALQRDIRTRAYVFNVTLQDKAI